ncbi:MAG TPA: hypothetical protein VEU32_16665 [Burkholderiales bacterium]|nr:hypothetical protein [Burkholderiales bacterium]
MLVLAAGCGNNPPVPAWQQNAFDSMQVFQQLYLSGDTAGAESEFKRARSELTATGRADLVARAELVRCAAQVASLVFEPCKGFEMLRRDAGAEERAYAEYLEGRVARTSSSEPFSRLVAYGVQMRTASIDPQGIANAVEISSGLGWRRPLLAWLGVQLKRAEQAGDSETAARLKRRIELVSG